MEKMIQTRKTWKNKLFAPIFIMLDPLLLNVFDVIGKNFTPQFEFQNIILKKPFFFELTNFAVVPIMLSFSFEHPDKSTKDIQIE